MKNKSIQNTNKQIQKCKERMTDRQTDRQTHAQKILLKFTRQGKFYNITVRNHTIHIVVSISANCKYIFNLEPNCLTEQ